MRGGGGHFGHCWKDSPQGQTLLSILVVFDTGNFGIATLQHVLAVHAAADTPALLDINARPTTTKRNRQRCDTCALCPLYPSMPQLVERSSVCSCV